MKVIYKSILILIIVLFSTTISADNLKEGYDFLVENGHLKLYINSSTTGIAIHQKKNDNIWYSNPKGTRNLKQQLTLEYFIENERKTINNYTDGVKHGQYQIVNIENGVRINYTIGKLWDAKDYLPVIISHEGFQDLLSLISNKDKKLFKENYINMQFEKIDALDYERPDVTNVNEMFEKYKLSIPGKKLTQNEEKELIELLISQIKTNSAGINNRNELKEVDLLNYRNESFYVLKKDIIHWYINDMINILQEAGYNPEKVVTEHLNYNIDPPSIKKEVFYIPIEYQLEDNDLVVTIPSSEIIYPEAYFNNIQEEGIPILHNIKVLEYFGATARSENGYMFVPYGSGALIDLDIKTSMNTNYSQPVYGRDYLLEKYQNVEIRSGTYALQPSRFNTWEQQIYLPVFGLKQGDKAFFSIIEKGESIANINAEIANRRNEYNNMIYSSFNIIPKNMVRLRREGRSGLNVYQSRPYQGDIRIRYSFLTGDEANYSGMANYYREYLKGNDVLTKLELDDEISFFLELIGAVTVRGIKWGFPSQQALPLTTYKQVIKIVDQLRTENVNNIKLVYNGWLQGGKEHVFPDKINLEKALGTKEDFSDLRDYLIDNRVEFFPDVNFTKIYSETNRNKYSSFYPDQTRSNIYDLNIENFLPIRRQGYYLSPSRFASVLDDFLTEYKRLGIEGISLAYIGEMVYSDFNKENMIDRQQAVEINQEQLKKMFDNYQLNTIITGGNKYVFPYTSNIIGNSLYNNELQIMSREVPFYQMVIKGYINFAGEPINLAGDYKKNVLKIIETGANPYFKWIYNDDLLLKNTNYNYLYSVNYKNWINEAFELYHSINNILGELVNQNIIKHEKVKENVYKSVYDNNKAVLVNYNNYKVVVDDIIIEAKGYTLIKVGEEK